MSLPKSIVFATGNPGKRNEVAAVLADLGIEVVGLDALHLDIDEPIEDQPTFAGNAVLKARHYAAATGRLVLADDSGLEVDALGGAPGVISARYAGVEGARDVVDPANNAKLLRELQGVPDTQRTARFVCVMALCDDRLTHLITRGEIEGRIIHEPRGVNGFGYDPLFLVPHLGRTTAELPAHEKNAISHRGQATRRLVEALHDMA